MTLWSYIRGFVVPQKVKTLRLEGIRPATSVSPGQGSFHHLVTFPSSWGHSHQQSSSGLSRLPRWGHKHKNIPPIPKSKSGYNFFSHQMPSEGLRAAPTSERKNLPWCLSSAFSSKTPHHLLGTPPQTPSLRALFRLALWDPGQEKCVFWRGLEDD